MPLNLLGRIFSMNESLLTLGVFVLFVQKNRFAECGFDSFQAVGVPVVIVEGGRAVAVIDPADLAVRGVIGKSRGNARRARDEFNQGGSGKVLPNQGKDAEHGKAFQRHDYLAAAAPLNVF